MSSRRPKVGVGADLLAMARNMTDQAMAHRLKELAVIFSPIVRVIIP
jgi:hypothetical protein